MKVTSKRETTMTCPKCFSVFITTSPEMMIWERCAACLSHIWDADDLMMSAEVATSFQYSVKAPAFTETH